MSMKRVLIFLVLSCGIAIVGAVVHGFLTASYYAELSSGSRVVVHGFDAIKSLVRVFGIFGYFKTLLSMSFFLFVHIFIGGLMALVLVNDKTNGVRLIRHE